MPVQQDIAHSDRGFWPQLLRRGRLGNLRHFGLESRNGVAFSSSENRALSESRHGVHNMDDTTLVTTLTPEVTMDEAKVAGFRGGLPFLRDQLAGWP
jgi:hypothetical protein